MFAHVKFIKDHQLKIVDMKEIQVLNGEAVKEKQICRVLKNGEYEKAIVLRLGDSQQEITDANNRKRIKIPKLNLSDLETPKQTSSRYDADNNVDYADDDVDDATDDDVTQLDEYDICRKKISQQKRGKVSSNYEVEGGLLKKHLASSMVFSLESIESESNAEVPAKAKELVARLLEVNKKHELAQLKITELENKLQNFEDVKKQVESTETKVNQILNNQQQILLLLGAGENVSFLTSKNDVQMEPPLFEQVDDKIHLGSNVFVNAQAWHKVQLEKDPSKWVKSLAVVIWGSEELAKRTVKGGSRPPLTPLKLRVMKDRYEEFLEKRGFAGEAKSTFASRMNSFLGGKISDLQPHRFKKRSLSNN